MDDKDLTSLSIMDEADTETIQLNSLLTQDLTPSGSFQLGRIPATTFGKLLEALPMPALLIDGSHCVAFANEACRKFSADYEGTEGAYFSSLFPEHSASRMLSRGFCRAESCRTESDLG